MPNAVDDAGAGVCRFGGLEDDGVVKKRAAIDKEEEVERLVERLVVALPPVEAYGWWLGSTWPTNDNK